MFCIYATEKKTSKMKLLLTFFIFSMSFGFNSQMIRNFQKKNDNNKKERTQMLNMLRSDIKNDIEQDVVFVVNHFMVSSEFAWMEGTVQRKDNSELRLPEEYDCCRVQALFKKVNGNWILKNNGAFATDVWYSCLLDEYTGLDQRIFPEITRRIVVCN